MLLISINGKMKFTLLFTILLIFFKPSFAQTNTFSEKGNVVIGITTFPFYGLHLLPLLSVRNRKTHQREKLFAGHSFSGGSKN